MWWAREFKLSQVLRFQTPAQEALSSPIWAQNWLCSLKLTLQLWKVAFPLSSTDHPYTGREWGGVSLLHWNKEWLVTALLQAPKWQSPDDFLRDHLIFSALCPVVQTEGYFQQVFEQVCLSASSQETSSHQEEVKDLVWHFCHQTHGMFFMQPTKAQELKKKGQGWIWYLPLPAIAMVNCNPDFRCQQRQMILNAALRMDVWHWEIGGPWMAWVVNYSSYQSNNLFINVYASIV